MNLRTNKFIALAIILIFLMSLLPLVSSNHIESNKKNQIGVCQETKLWMKVCYLRTLEEVDSDDFGEDPYSAEFRWEIWAFGGIDEDGNDRWELSVSDSHSQMSELQLEQEEGNPAWWDITGLNRIPIRVVLWDKDPWPVSDEYLDINGYFEDTSPRKWGRTVEFTYYPLNDTYDFEKSGGRLSNNHGGCVEFNGKWDIEKENDCDTIMRIKIWADNGNSNSPPEKPERPSGPSGGFPDTKYKYSTSTTDSDEDQIMYQFDWGDGTRSSWLGPYNSGKRINNSHIWTGEGNYKIRVRARDDPHGEISEWSDPMDLAVIKSRTRYFNTLIQRILSLFF
jgi:hypothetical protein